jgi:hypothetical protein
LGEKESKGVVDAHADFHVYLVDYNMYERRSSNR